MHCRRSFVALLACLSLGACSGGGGGGSDSADTPSADDSPDAFLAGPAAMPPSVAPTFVNGADADSIATRWRCDNAASPASAFRVAFLDDGSGVLDFDVQPDGRSMSWSHEGDVVEMRWGTDLDSAFRFDPVRFVSDVGFVAPTVIPSDTRVIMESEDVDGDLAVGSFSCVLQDNAGVALQAAPFETAEGPAAWPRPEPVEVGPLPRIQGIYVLYESGFFGGMFQFVTRLAVAFDDGTVTRNTRQLFEQGVYGSRQSSPNSWGRWRGSASNGEDFELDWDEDGDYSSTVANRATRQQPGTVLDGCYTATSAVSFGDPSGGSVSTRTFCFRPDGVFSHSSSSSTLTPEATIASGSDSAGVYYVDGFTIELRYGNGAVVTQLFGNFGTHVSVSNRVFL